MAARTQRSANKPSRPGMSQTRPRLAGGDHSRNLDRLIHEKSRLAIVSALAANKHLSFNDLKSLLDISDGNLSAHARKLEEAGYITCKKDFDGRMPRTRYSLSAGGRKALKHYIAHMEALIEAIKE